MDAQELKTFVTYKHIMDNNLNDLIRSAKAFMATRSGERSDLIKQYTGYPGGPSVEALLTSGGNRLISAKYHLTEHPAPDAADLRGKLERLVRRIEFAIIHRIDMPRTIAGESRALGRLIQVAREAPTMSLATSVRKEMSAEEGWKAAIAASAAASGAEAPKPGGWIASKKGPPKPASRTIIEEETEESPYKVRLRILLKDDHATYIRWIFLRDIVAYVSDTEKTRLLWNFVTKRVEPLYETKYGKTDLADTEHLVGSLISMARWEDEKNLPTRPMETPPGRAEIGDEVAIFRVTPTTYGIALYDPPGGKGELMGERDLGQREAIKLAMEIAEEYGRKVVYVTRKSRRRRLN